MTSSKQYLLPASRIATAEDMAGMFRTRNTIAFLTMFTPKRKSTVSRSDLLVMENVAESAQGWYRLLGQTYRTSLCVLYLQSFNFE